VVKLKITVSTGGDVIRIWDVRGHPLMLASAVKSGPRLEVQAQERERQAN
jgi:hypothetical protein